MGCRDTVLGSRVRCLRSGGGQLASQVFLLRRSACLVSMKTAAMVLASATTARAPAHLHASGHRARTATARRQAPSTAEAAFSRLLPVSFSGWSVGCADRRWRHHAHRRLPVLVIWGRLPGLGGATACARAGTG
jgi:hypothetical protein